MGPHDFLHALWGEVPPGLVQIWELDTKRSSYYRAADATRIFAGRTDVYTAVATAHKDHGRTKRATARQALAIAGLWLDLDVDGGPAGKTGAAPDLESALAIATAIASPTITVNSGYGIHAWYLFDKPWRFTSADEQAAGALASAQWFALHRTKAARYGAGVDHAHDLARLMRLPGTLNGKGPAPVPVDGMMLGPRYTREDLLAAAAAAGDVDTAPGQQLTLGDGTPIAVSVPQAETPTARKVELLIEQVPDFAAAWHHRGGLSTRGWSLSEWDLSLCGQAAQAGFTDQELADLIALHRNAYNDTRGKAGRLDYLQRTIRIIRTPKAQVTELQQRHAAALRRAA